MNTHKLQWFLFLMMLIRSTPGSIESDSIEHKLKQISDPRKKIELLNKLAWENRYDSPQKAMAYADTAIGMAQSEKTNYLLAQSFNYKGLGLRSINQYDSALVYFQQALKIAWKQSDTIQIAYSCNNIAGIYRIVGDYPQAMENIFTAMNLFEKLNDDPGIAYCAINLAILYRYNQKYDEALRFLHQAEEIRLQNNDSEGLALVYFQIAEVQSELKNPHQSLEYYLKADSIYQIKSSPYQIAASLAGLAQAYYDLNDLEKALEKRMQALKISLGIGEKNNTIHNMIGMAKIYNKLGDYSKSIAYLHKAITLSHEIELGSQIIECLQTAIDIHVQQGNYFQAYLYQKEYQTMKDSIFTLAQAEKMEELQSHYKINQQQQMLNLRENEIRFKDELMKQRTRQRNILFLSLIVIISTLSYLIFILKRKIALNSTLKHQADQIKNQHAALSYHTLQLDEANKKLQELNLTLEDKNRELYRISITDHLTSIYNRLYVIDMLEKELARSIRHHIPFGIVLIDLDFFKSVNDTHGHQAGDIILQQTTSLIGNTIRKEDVLGRYGGEEFILLLPGMNRNQLYKVADKLREIVAQKEFLWKECILHITFSGGIAVYTPGTTITADELITHADYALYQAKKAGRNRIAVYEKPSHSSAESPEMQSQSSISASP